jgi:hypothetical protein
VLSFVVVIVVSSDYPYHHEVSDTILFIQFFPLPGMEKEIKTEILIHATPEKVWAILTDFDQYKNWNPFIRSITGEVAVGKIITVRLEPPGAWGMTVRPKVLAFEKHKELRWIGHLVFPGLFDGEHTFELIDRGNGTTTFRQTEKFRGIFVVLFEKKLDSNTTNGFKLMNQKLKESAEQK